MMDIKKELDDELPPIVLEITYDGGRNQQNAIDSCNTEQLTSNQCSIRVKHEPNDVTDTCDNEEDVLQKIREETDFGCLNCKQEVTETAAIVKTEEVDLGQCYYAEWNPHQDLPTKGDFSSNNVTTSIDSSKIRQKLRNKLQVQSKEQEMIRSILNNDLKAVVSLERSIFNKENFACGICFTVLPNRKSLITHKAKCKPHKNRIKSHKCDICDYKSAYPQHLKIHKYKHGGEKPFKCDLCQYQCTFSARLKEHKSTHTGEKSFVCNICNCVCATADLLRIHKKKHVGEKPFHCVDCTFKCARAVHLKAHRVIHTKQLYSCGKCDFKTNRSHNFKRHKFLVHANEKNFKCGQCDYVCNKSSYMKMHRLTHSGKKLYKCDTCAYTCAFRCNLKVHWMTHSGEKPFQCEQCSFKCARTNGLKKHMQRWHSV